MPSHGTGMCCYSVLKYIEKDKGLFLHTQHHSGEHKKEPTSLMSQTNFLIERSDDGYCNIYIS